MLGADWVKGLLIGGAAGILSGLAGVGGGIIMIPLFSYALGYSPHTAQGTALFVFSLPVLVGSAYTYYQNRRTDWWLALFIAGGVLLSGYFIADQVQTLRSTTLSAIFSGFLILVGFYLIFRSRITGGSGFVTPHEVPKLRRARWGLLIGLMSGALSGLTGVGGGIVIVPLIRFLLRYEQHVAQGTSLTTLSIPVLMGAMLPYYRQGHVEIQMGLAAAGGLLIASILSARWAQRLRSQTLQIVFGGLLIAVGLFGLLR